MRETCVSEPVDSEGGVAEGLDHGRIDEVDVRLLAEANFAETMRSCGTPLSWASTEMTGAPWAAAASTPDDPTPANWTEPLVSPAIVV